jgi:hypothetical protein
MLYRPITYVYWGKPCFILQETIIQLTFDAGKKDRIGLNE